MEIIFHGQPSRQDAERQLRMLFDILWKKYKIEQFREMHISLTLLDSQGFDVELVDQATNRAYRIFDVYQQGPTSIRLRGSSALRLVRN